MGAGGAEAGPAHAEPRPLPAPRSDPRALRARVARAAALLRVHPARLRPGQEVPGAVGDRGGRLPVCGLRGPGGAPLQPQRPPEQGGEQRDLFPHLWAPLPVPRPALPKAAGPDGGRVEGGFGIPSPGRVQKEIDEAIGQARRPEMADQARMPFTVAVVHEVQRFADIIPLGVPHMTSQDTEVRGFLIPKGTTLITNLSSVLKDEAAWKEPFRFQPEHFLDAQGRFVKPPAFMPFSAGRRSCLGEPLARMELFLFFTCLLQRFSFSVPAGQPRPSDHGAYAFLVAPHPYQLCALPR
uniref:Cytochrome P450 family 2 subfamily D member 6 n=1 Tax=Pipistrellus kuhlii TaxID=59472 RepID=A0A7J7RDL7_PIPKU|nr:cytochrome P450 family 2 subfamily D member 6 [Pipistrellus kuhlii]